MSHGEYPFDPSGNYVTAWAAEGERSSGRNAVYGTDYSSWHSSHGTSSSSTKKSTPTSKKKTSVSTPKPSSSTSRSSTTTSTTPPKPPATPSKKPSSTSRTASHTVRSGDTLYGLALRYKTTVSKIKTANGLKSDLIRPGQNLRIVK